MADLEDNGHIPARSLKTQRASLSRKITTNNLTQVVIDVDDEDHDDDDDDTQNEDDKEEEYEDVIVEQEEGEKEVEEENRQVEDDYEDSQLFDDEVTPKRKPVARNIQPSKKKRVLIRPVVNKVIIFFCLFNFRVCVLYIIQSFL